MVQRYDYFGKTESFEPFDRGECVKYEDYAALENLLIAVVAAVGPCDTPDHLLDALCEAGVLE